MSDTEQPFPFRHLCFGCGHDNPIGLHLRFRVEQHDGAPSVVARYEPRAEDQGFPGYLHGGILSTLVDEAMAWAMFAATGSFGVTAKMETRYRRAVDVEEPLVLRAHVTSTRGRRVAVAGDVFTEGGERLVEATALFLRLPPEQEAEMVAQLRDQGVLEGQLEPAQ